MKAAIYSRKSKFTGKGESVENQVQLCREYCQQHNIEIYDIYEDEGFTGANIDRPEFQRMIKDSKKKRFDVLVCYRLDRISRRIIDFSSLIDDLQELEISFISIKEQFDTTTPLGRAMMFIASVFAQLERETTAERLRDNMHQLARTGRWLGGICPTGFESEPLTYYDDEMKVRKMYRLKAVQSELKIVKELFYKLIDLGGLWKLHGYTYKAGLKTRNGRDFCIRSLQSILNNPVYCVADKRAYEYCVSKGMDVAAEEDEFDGIHGLIAYNKRYEVKGQSPKRKKESDWIIAVGKHKGVIKSEDWIRAQQILEARQRNYRRGTSKVGILSSLLTCSKCGSNMRIVFKYDSNREIKQYYYKCRLKEDSRGVSCDMANINGIKADNTIKNAIMEIALNREVYIKKYKEKTKQISDENTNRIDDMNIFIKERTAIEKQILNLTKQLSENSDSSAAKYIIKQIEDLDKNMKALNNKIENIEDIKEFDLIRQMNIDIFNENLRLFATEFDNLDIEGQKKLLRGIIKEIHWDGTDLDIELFDL